MPFSGRLSRFDSTRRVVTAMTCGVTEEEQMADQLAKKIASGPSGSGFSRNQGNNKSFLLHEAETPQSVNFLTSNRDQSLNLAPKALEGRQHEATKIDPRQALMQHVQSNPFTNQANS